MQARLLGLHQPLAVRFLSDSRLLGLGKQGSFILFGEDEQFLVSSGEVKIEENCTESRENLRIEVVEVVEVEEEVALQEAEKATSLECEVPLSLQEETEEGTRGSENRSQRNRAKEGAFLDVLPERSPEEILQDEEDFQDQLSTTLTSTTLLKFKRGQPQGLWGDYIIRLAYSHYEYESKFLT